MDLGFAVQALSAGLAPAVHTLPAELDREVARLKLAALGVAIDPPTADQSSYATSWRAGT